MTLLSAALLIGLYGCSSKTKEDVSSDTDEGTYFSIREFAADQFRNYRGVPVMIDQIMTLNGVSDTVVSNSFEADWESIFERFFVYDIGDPSYLDRYNAEVFRDGQGAIVLYYSAKEEKLPMRSMHVRLDIATNKVLSIYMEIQKKSFWADDNQKLYYVPMKLIQIQEYSKPFIGKEKDLQIVWKFLI